MKKDLFENMLKLNNNFIDNINYIVNLIVYYNKNTINKNDIYNEICNNNYKYYEYNKIIEKNSYLNANNDFLFNIIEDNFIIIYHNIITINITIKMYKYKYLKIKYYYFNNNIFNIKFYIDNNININYTKMYKFKYNNYILCKKYKNSKVFIYYDKEDIDRINIITNIYNKNIKKIIYNDIDYNEPHKINIFNKNIHLYEYFYINKDLFYDNENIYDYIISSYYLNIFKINNNNNFILICKKLFVINYNKKKFKIFNFTKNDINYNIFYKKFYFINSYYTTFKLKFLL